VKETVLVEHMEVGGIAVVVSLNHEVEKIPFIFTPYVIITQHNMLEKFKELKINSTRFNLD
jgi:hypothetical protein